MLKYSTCEICVCYLYIHPKLKEEKKPVLHLCRKTMTFSIGLSSIFQNTCHNIVGPILGREEEDNLI